MKIMKNYSPLEGKNDKVFKSLGLNKPRDFLF